MREDTTYLMINKDIGAQSCSRISEQMERLADKGKAARIEPIFKTFEQEFAKVVERMKETVLN